jgi:hypothetical protein
MSVQENAKEDPSGMNGSLRGCIGLHPSENLGSMLVVLKSMGMLE